MRTLVIASLCCCAVYGELRPIPIAQSVAEGLSDPAASGWNAIPAVPVALQRTPLLFPTDQPASLDIPSVEVRAVRQVDKTFVRLEWQDKSRETTGFAKAERAWQGEHLVKQSGATDRFSDACAVMIPVNPADPVFPSLQMGDAAHPVRIYFWDSSRGASLMEATGRETTHRTGKTFPAQGNWAAGKWSAVLELPSMPEGAPIAVAVWNGQQQDRDGRKYFSIWHRMQ